ncbi:MAG: mercuric transport protein [Acidobacteria bacterium]|nr:mercuric transport protein [Acidobacteriota bacterium]
MKLALAVVGGALGASACCIGPVFFSLLGAGALGAASVKLEPYRPWFIGLTVLLVAGAFYGAYRPNQAEACRDGVCTPQSRRAAKVLAWIVAAVAAMLIAFPYYVGWFV